ncbi:DUF4870 domain-containing protein [Noviherbaspirillum cavernae]|uniref:DUF4870 domain-containing protein n=1 Tax=Noviherbaspirillum cavernae TaxID=2320862 RepID=A0A418WX73_9BURK|nr:DUF4870 domain-containing protein [Noviherbaspirillum cavernae]RJG04787.1 DUF4870 domain-containing protein [Noviherbaspirillum cavernae]
MNEIIETDPTKDECNLAMLAHLLGIFTGFVGALVLWLVRKDDGGFAAQEAKEALNFQITLAIAFVASILLKVILIGLLLIPLVFIANFVLSLVAAIAASKGKAYRYPFILRLVR